MTIPAAEHRTDRPVLEMPLTLAIQAAAAMLTSASKDEVTPVLTAARYDGDYLLATDRYRVARFPVPTQPEKDEDRLELGAPFLIPRAALDWVAKITVKSLRIRANLPTMTDSGYTIRYEHDDDARTVTASVVDMDAKTERSQAFDAVSGNFPPVLRLFPAPDAEPAAMTQAFTPTLLVEILNYCKKYGNERESPVTFTFHSHGNGGGLAPALIEGADASFLLMPNLTVR